MSKSPDSGNGKEAGTPDNADIGANPIPAATAPVENFDPPPAQSSRRIFQNGDTDRTATRDN
jgi:hypothetical protein